jgi:hypothetical protein
VDERAFDEMLEEGLKWGDGGFMNGSGVKTALVSARWLTEIQWFAKNKLEYQVLDEQIGFSCRTYVAPHGKLNIIPWPLLDAIYPDRMYILDFNHLTYRYHQGRDTGIEKDRGGNGIDGYQEEWLSDVSIEVGLEASHVIVKGLSV